MTRFQFVCTDPSTLHSNARPTPDKSLLEYNSQERSGAVDSFSVCVSVRECVWGQISHSPCLFLSCEYSSRTFGQRARERPGTESADSSDFIQVSVLCMCVCLCPWATHITHTSDYTHVDIQTPSSIPKLHPSSPQHHHHLCGKRFAKPPRFRAQSSLDLAEQEKLTCNMLTGCISTVNRVMGETHPSLFQTCMSFFHLQYTEQPFWCTAQKKRRYFLEYLPLFSTKEYKSCRFGMEVSK